jgi:hypothetical protein
VYGVGGAEGRLVVEVENASPAPFALAWVLRGVHRFVPVDDNDLARITIDDASELVSATPVLKWAAVTDGRLQLVVTGGQARDIPVEPRVDRAARLDVALLVPVPHRTRQRVVVALARERRTSALPTSTTGLPSAADAARGWAGHVEAGARVELPDARLASMLRVARTQVLLGGAARRVDGPALAALEDWGHEADAADAWQRATMSARRAARRARRAAAADASWAGVEALAGLVDARFLLALRQVLVSEVAPDRLVLLSDWPPRWRGAPIEVHGIPTRAGAVSYAVRWHGDRPALLWDAPTGVRLRIPGLDPAWETDVATGEALLSPGPRTEA